MSRSSSRNRVFTIEEANKTLPLVRAIAADYMRLQQDVSDRSDRLSAIAARREQSSSDVYSDELEVAVRKLKKDSLRLDELVAEFRQLGVQPFGHDGTVEFPSLMDGRLVLLSWRVGEPEVLYWRDPDVDGARRELLGATATVGTGECGETLGF